MGTNFPYNNMNNEQRKMNKGEFCEWHTRRETIISKKLANNSQKIWSPFGISIITDYIESSLKDYGNRASKSSTKFT